MSYESVENSLEAEAIQTMAKERLNASFILKELIDYWNGGSECTRKKKLALQLVSRDAELCYHKDFFDVSRDVSRGKSMQQLRRFNEVKNSLKDPELQMFLYRVLEEYDRSFGMKAYVHEVLFRESLWTQGTDAQWKKYESDINNMRIIGCYAMTELGHSSHLQGIETTATFDRSNQEFIIHTPSLTATKWWIGMAGQTATHTIALCQLIIDGKRHGLHWFIVPLRNREDGRLCPGVSVGDVGAKMGRNSLDNGWIQFTNVRIPRENMLMRWAQVSFNGEYIPPPNPTLVYTSLIGERMLVTSSVAEIVSQIVTIAVRYGAIRRQSSNNQQVLDFQIYQRRTMPLLAMIWACCFTFRIIRSKWEIELRLSLNPSKQKEFINASHDMHSLTAGLKAWLGYWAVDALEICRRCLGGHGYSSYNAIAGQINDFGVLTTGGGDNIVLAQQNARNLLACYRKAMQGRVLVGSSIRYLNDLSKHQRNSKLLSRSAKDLLLNNVPLEAFRWLSITMIVESANALQDSISNGATSEDAWNENMMILLDASKVHIYYLLLENFVSTVENIPDTRSFKTIIRTLRDLLGVHFIDQFAEKFLLYGYMDREQITWAQTMVNLLCKQVRKECIPLVDAFDHPDWILKAPFGRYDGAIYTHYFHTVKDAPNAVGVSPYWREHIYPMVRPNL